MKDHTVVGEPTQGELVQGDDDLVMAQLDPLSRPDPDPSDEGGYCTDEPHQPTGQVDQIGHRRQGFTARIAAEPQVSPDSDVYQIGRLSHDLSGGFLATMPNQKSFENPEISEYVKKYHKASDDYGWFWGTWEDGENVVSGQPSMCVDCHVRHAPDIRRNNS